MNAEELPNGLPKQLLESSKPAPGHVHASSLAGHRNRDQDAPTLLGLVGLWGGAALTAHPTLGGLVGLQRRQDTPAYLARAGWPLKSGSMHFCLAFAVPGQVGQGGPGTVYTKCTTGCTVGICQPPESCLAPRWARPQYAGSQLSSLLNS